jgi:hypothetical protein
MDLNSKTQNLIKEYNRLLGGPGLEVCIQTALEQAIARYHQSGINLAHYRKNPSDIEDGFHHVRIDFCDEKFTDRGTKLVIRYQLVKTKQYLEDQIWLLCPNNLKNEEAGQMILDRIAELAEVSNLTDSNQILGKIITVEINRIFPPASKISEFNNRKFYYGNPLDKKGSFYQINY